MRRYRQTTLTPEALRLLNAYKSMSGLRSHSEAVYSCIRDSMRWYLFNRCVSIGMDYEECRRMAIDMVDVDSLMSLVDLEYFLSFRLPMEAGIRARREVQA